MHLLWAIWKTYIVTACTAYPTDLKASEKERPCLLRLTPCILSTSWSDYRSTSNQCISSQSIASVQLNRSWNIVHQPILVRTQADSDIEWSSAITHPSYVQLMRDCRLKCQQAKRWFWTLSPTPHRRPTAAFMVFDRAILHDDNCPSPSNTFLSPRNTPYEQSNRSK